MTNRRVLVSLLVLGAVAPRAAHGQTTIDFQDLPTGACRYFGSSVVSRGFRFVGGPDAVFTCSAGVLQHNTTSAIINANGRSVLTMSRPSGDPFTLSSFYAGGRTAEFSPDQAVSLYSTATGIDILGTFFGGGTVSLSIFLDAVAPYAWAQYALPETFANLQSVRFSAVGDGPTPEFLLDDLVVDAVTATPEPGSLALVATGLLGLAGAIRWRRRHG